MGAHAEREPEHIFGEQSVNVSLLIGSDFTCFSIIVLHIEIDHYLCLPGSSLFIKSQTAETNGWS
jgi:hypothetical protein